MVGLDSASEHFVTLKNWASSAEYNRLQLLSRIEVNTHGSYRVRMQGNAHWVECDSPPPAGAAEWLFLNQRAVPLLYWNSKRRAVVLI
jgi:hypothetical protein